MTRIASFAVHKLQLSNMMETQRRLIETQMQVSSGKVARHYDGIALDSRRLLNLETSVAEANRFLNNIAVTEGRLQLMESTVAGAFDVASRARDLLVNALNFENASLMVLNQRAEDMIGELTNLLNVRQDNRYLFAGGRTDTAPVDASILLSTTPAMVDAAEFTGGATTSGSGITGLPGIVGVKVLAGSTGDAFQFEYDDVAQTFTVTNLSGGASATQPLGGAVPAGQTRDIAFDVGGKTVTLTIDSAFNPGVPITTDTITGNVDSGLGAFGAITLTGTNGNVSTINGNTIETSGTAASATLTLSSSDGNFVATGIDLSTPGLVPVTLTNAATGATISLNVDVTTGLDDAAIASALTEIRLDNFLENVAASNGAVDPKVARPDDPGYDPTNPSYYVGDFTGISARVDTNATVDYGVTAAEPGFEKLFRALYTVRNANVQSGAIDRAALESALGLMIEAIRDIPDVRARVGSDLKVLESMKVRHEDFVVFTNEAISRIEDVDIAEAVARISTEQTQLEASFMLTARLANLSLANFLR